MKHAFLPLCFTVGAEQETYWYTQIYSTLGSSTVLGSGSGIISSKFNTRNSEKEATLLSVCSTKSYEKSTNMCSHFPEIVPTIRLDKPCFKFLHITILNRMQSGDISGRAQTHKFLFIPLKGQITGRFIFFSVCLLHIRLSNLNVVEI